MTLEKAQQALSQYWGYEQFRSPQAEVINCLLEGHDALVLLPTGAGKSLCFQIPAIVQSGLTLVLSPLISLMENQVQELQQKQIKAALLHSQLPRPQRRKILGALQELDLLYLSPESLLSPGLWPQICNLNIRSLVIDEAHCISQWGLSFRPVYRRLGAVRAALQQGKEPISVAAFTATANPMMQQEIKAVLQLKRPQVFRVSPYRANLDLRIQFTCSPGHRRHQILKFIRAQGHSSGLIYTRSRRDSEALASDLQQKGQGAMAYHAGLPPRQRRQIETDWLASKIAVVICTSAFGMGINKPDVRFVGHLHPPLTLAEYIQEIGRAGRDGLPAQVLLMASEPTGLLDPHDRQQRRFFKQQRDREQRLAYKLIKAIPHTGCITNLRQEIANAEMALSLLHGMGRLRWLDPFHYALTDDRPAHLRLAQQQDEMAQFIRTRHCRWRLLLNAFGFDSELRCGHCDRCRRVRKDY